MRLKIRDLEVDLKPLYFKDWAQVQEEGLDPARVGKTKKCPACVGSGLEDGDVCTTCNGAKRIPALTYKDAWLLIRMLLNKAGVPAEVVETLSIEEVQGIFAQEGVANFFNPKNVPQPPPTSAT